MTSTVGFRPTASKMMVGLALAVVGAGTGLFAVAAMAQQPATIGPTFSPTPAARSAGGLLSAPSQPAGGSSLLGPSSPPPVLRPTAPDGPPQPVILAREQPLVVVDDEPISTYQLRQRMSWDAMSSGHRPTDAELPQLQRQSLRSLIDLVLEDHYIRRQEIERKMKPGTLVASDQDVDDYLTSIARQNQDTLPEFMQTLESAGLSPRTVRAQARIEISWQNWINGFYGNKVRISDEEANNYIRDLEAVARKPQYHVGEIFVDNQHAGDQQRAVAIAQSIVTQLQQRSSSFEQLAFQYSSLPSAATGGDAGWLGPDQLPEQVATVIEQLRPGYVTQPIPVQNGVYVVLLKEEKAGSTSSMVSLKQVAVMLPANADAAATQAAQTKLLALKPQIKNCDTIEATARAAGLQVGDLGLADTKDLSPAFRTAVESLQPNQVSDPIRTDVGLHLVALCSRTASGVDLPTLEEVKRQLYNIRLGGIATRELRNLRSSATIKDLQ